MTLTCFTDAGQDEFYANLAITESGANYCHFPNRPVYNSKYFKMLTAEKRDESGKYIKVRVRNEALDCRIYGNAVLAVMVINVNHLPRPVLYIGEEKVIKKRAVAEVNYVCFSAHAMSSRLPVDVKGQPDEGSCLMAIQECLPLT